MQCDKPFHTIAATCTHNLTFIQPMRNYDYLWNVIQRHKWTLVHTFGLSIYSHQSFHFIHTHFEFHEFYVETYPFLYGRFEWRWWWYSFNFMRFDLFLAVILKENSVHRLSRNNNSFWSIWIGESNLNRGTINILVCMSNRDGLWLIHMNRLAIWSNATKEMLANSSQF